MHTWELHKGGHSAERNCGLFVDGCAEEGSLNFISAAGGTEPLILQKQCGPGSTLGVFGFCSKSDWVRGTSLVLGRICDFVESASRQHSHCSPPEGAQ